HGGDQPLVAVGDRDRRGPRGRGRGKRNGRRVGHLRPSFEIERLGLGVDVSLAECLTDDLRWGGDRSQWRDRAGLSPAFLARTPSPYHRIGGRAGCTPGYPPRTRDGPRNPV